MLASLNVMCALRVENFKLQHLEVLVAFAGYASLELTVLKGQRDSFLDRIKFLLRYALTAESEINRINRVIPSIMWIVIIPHPSVPPKKH